MAKGRFSAASDGSAPERSATTAKRSGKEAWFIGSSCLSGDRRDGERLKRTGNRPACQRRIEVGGRRLYRIRFPSAESTSSVPTCAVVFRVSRIGLVSTTSSELSR